MLNTLIHTDRAIKNHTFASVARRFINRCATYPYSLCSYQYTFRVEAVKYHFKAVTFCAYAVPFRNPKIVDKQHIGVYRVATHFMDSTYFDFAAIKIGIEQ